MLYASRVSQSMAVTRRYEEFSVRRIVYPGLEIILISNCADTASSLGVEQKYRQAA